MDIYKIIQEEVDTILDEDYPSSFDMDFFKTLTSFNKRIKYCDENLKRIGGGSSRIVYKIDDEKVLKLARNRKGLDQNEVEVSQGNYYDLKDIVADVFDNHDDYHWVEMEYAQKLTKSKFKSIVGFDFEMYSRYIENYYYKVNPTKAKNSYFQSFSSYMSSIFELKYVDSNDKSKEIKNKEFNEYLEKIEESIWENEFMYNILNYIGAYDVLIGDLLKLNSYGLVKRNGEDYIVLIDFGLTPGLFDKHY